MAILRSFPKRRRDNDTRRENRSEEGDVAIHHLQEETRSIANVQETRRRHQNQIWNMGFENKYDKSHSEGWHLSEE